MNKAIREIEMEESLQYVEGLTGLAKLLKLFTVLASNEPMGEDNNYEKWVVRSNAFIKGLRKALSFLNDQQQEEVLILVRDEWVNVSRELMKQKIFMNNINTTKH